MIADIPPRPSSIVVFTPVGCTVLTRMFRSASSLASDLATPTTPVFAATYGAKNGRPLRPAVELVIVIDPPRPPRVPHAGEVDVDGLLPDFRSHLVPLLERADACVGRHDVQATQLRDPRRHDMLEVVVVPDVGFLLEVRPVM